MSDKGLHTIPPKYQQDDGGTSGKLGLGISQFRSASPLIPVHYAMCDNSRIRATSINKVPKMFPEIRTNRHRAEVFVGSITLIA